MKLKPSHNSFTAEACEVEMRLVRILSHLPAVCCCVVSSASALGSDLFFAGMLDLLQPLDLLPLLHHKGLENITSVSLISDVIYKQQH